MAFRVEFSERANEEFDEIVEYIKNALGNPGAALHFIEQLEKFSRLVRETPEMYAVVDAIASERKLIRKCPIGNYLVFYRVIPDAKLIDVISIMYGRRNYENLL